MTRFEKRMELWKSGKDADLEFIEQTVYDGLKKSIPGIVEPLEKIRHYEEEIKSGIYNDAGVRRLNEKITEQSMQRRAARDAAIKAAKDKVNEYREYVEKNSRLDPAKLTDDIKLLQPGIVLTERDFIGMLERNAGNSTMEQTILRAAKERGVNLPYYHTDIDEVRRADSLDNTIHYFEHWIENEQAGEMLDKFFGVYGPDIVEIEAAAE